VAWVALTDFVLPADVEESDAFGDVVVALVFAVAGCPCPALPLEAWRAPAAGMKTLMLSSAQVTPNEVLRILPNAWSVNVNPSPAKRAAVQ